MRAGLRRVKKPLQSVISLKKYRLRLEDALRQIRDAETQTQELLQKTLEELVPKDN